MDNQKYNGAVSLLTVILVSAIILVLTITTLLLNIDLGDTNIRSRERISAKVVAYSCFEETMAIIKDDLNYNGVFEIDINGGSCVATVTNIAPGNSELTVVATFNNSSYQMDITVDSTVYPVEVTHN